MTSARRACRAAAVLLAAGAAAARAETLYVIEQLVVTVNSAPGADGERIASVKSGDRVEVLERIGEEIHVRLANGKDGWIGARYLSGDEPLRPRLAQREAELAQLKQDVSRLEGELGAARAAASASPPVPATPPPASAPPGAATSAADAGSPAAGPLFAAAGDETVLRLWPWALGAALAGLVLGFALGALVLDRYIRRKYGGLRIY